MIWAWLCVLTYLEILSWEIFKIYIFHGDWVKNYVGIIFVVMWKKIYILSLFKSKQNGMMHHYDTNKVFVVFIKQKKEHKKAYTYLYIYIYITYLKNYSKISPFSYSNSKMYLEKFIPTIPTYLHFIYLHNQQCKEKRNYFGLPIQSVFFHRRTIETASYLHVLLF